LPVLRPRVLLRLESLFLEGLDADAASWQIDEWRSPALIHGALPSEPESQ
jgi:hypothetical protein